MTKNVDYCLLKDDDVIFCDSRSLYISKNSNSGCPNGVNNQFSRLKRLFIGSKGR